MIRPLAITIDKFSIIGSLNLCAPGMKIIRLNCQPAAKDLHRPLDKSYF
jgi:hypothetical protein